MVVLLFTCISYATQEVKFLDNEILITVFPKWNNYCYTEDDF